MRLDLTKIGLIVSIALNIFQSASKEAREWYVATHEKPKASTGDYTLIKYEDKISFEKVKPSGAK